MADTTVFRQGKYVVNVPANSKIAVATNGKAIISTLGGSAQAQIQEPVFLAVAAAGVPYLSAVFSTSIVTTVVVENVQESPTFVQVGVSPNPITWSDGLYQPTPGTLNATGALTLALLQTRIVTSTTGAAVVATLDTGTVMDAAQTWAVGDSIDWNVINTGGNAFTVTAAAGHTIVGVAAVATV